MKRFFTVFSVALLGLALVFFWFGTFEAVACPRINANPYLSRDGSWIEIPIGFSEEDLRYVGNRIGSEINALRSVHEHTNRSNGYFALSSVCGIVGGFISFILRKKGSRQLPLGEVDPPALPT